MKEMSVYWMAMKFYKGSEIRVHLCSVDENGNDVVQYKVFADNLDEELYQYKDYSVTMFDCPKKGVIHMIAYKEK